MAVLPTVWSLVDSLATGPITIERQGQKTQTKYGDWQAGAVTSFVVTPVSAHNATGRDLLQVPEADRNRETVKFIAREGSFPAGQERGWRVADKGYQADVAIYRGRRFRFINSRDFELQGRVWIGLGVLEELQSVP